MIFVVWFKSGYNQTTFVFLLEIFPKKHVIVGFVKNKQQFLSYFMTNHEYQFSTNRKGGNPECIMKTGSVLWSLERK